MSMHMSIYMAIYTSENTSLQSPQMSTQMPVCISVHTRTMSASVVDLNTAALSIGAFTFLKAEIAVAASAEPKPPAAASADDRAEL